MFNIVLLSSFHREIGNCNSIELHKLIESINPEIIFEELDIDSYNYNYWQNGPNTTETKAIYRYSQNKRIQHIPVDTYDIEYSLKEDVKYMYDYMDNCIEYRQLFECQLKLLQNNGFIFLNSDECSAIISKIQNMEDTIQKQSNNDRLKMIYKTWIEINNKRENIMINNIYRHCEKHAFNIGLLITGSDHRNTLIEKINKMEHESIKLNWSYWK